MMGFTLLSKRPQRGAPPAPSATWGHTARDQPRDKRAPTRTGPCRHPGLRLQGSGTVRNDCSPCKPPSLFCSSRLNEAGTQFSNWMLVRLRKCYLPKFPFRGSGSWKELAGQQGARVTQGISSKRQEGVPCAARVPVLETGREAQGPRQHQE